MTIYQIDYDLQSPQQDYEELYDAIEALGSSTHMLDSTWLVDTDEDSAGDVRDELKDSIDSDDRLFVARIDGGGWSWGTNFSDGSTAWLKEHIS